MEGSFPVYFGSNGNKTFSVLKRVANNKCEEYYGKNIAERLSLEAVNQLE